MNEFVIWIKTKMCGKDFIDCVHIDVDKMIEEDKTIDCIIDEHLEEVDQSHCSCTISEAQNYCDCMGGDWSGEYEIISKNDYVGISDINDIKIISDSSIFEFDYNPGYISSKDETYRGYFEFNENTLSYMINIPKEDYKWHFIEVFSRIKNIRIIGTLQENKELLKEK